MVRVSRWISALTLALLLGIVTTCSIEATSDPPSWRQNLTCDPALQQYRGVEYCTAASDKIHVIVVDLHSPGVGLEYVMSEGVDSKNQSGESGECQDVNRSTKKLGGPGCDDPNNRAYYPVMSLTRAVDVAKNRFQNVAAVANSDYGAKSPSKNPQKWRDHGPEGFTVVRGDRLDGPANGDNDDNAVRRPWLAVSQNAPLRAELGQFSQDNGGKPDWVYTGVGGGPWLIRQGVIQEQDINTCQNNAPGSRYKGACYEGADQTAVGLSQDGQWLYLVVDLREGKLLDTADFMREKLDVWDAIKFDGGGSTQLAYAGSIVTQGDGRQLSQYLAVIAEPGSGIGEEHAAGTAFSAQPTAPLFFDVVLPGETAHLHLEVRNTGTAAWEPGQGIEMRQVEKDVISPVVESYALPHPVPPDETVTWDIELNTGGSRFTTLRFQMYQGNTPFGPEIGAVVITIPEQLKAKEKQIRQAIERQIDQWQQQAGQELDRRLEELQKQLVELIQREAERQAQNLIDKLCGSSALLPAGLAVWVLRRRRR